jgi:sodium-dependent phosphate transporter
MNTAGYRVIQTVGSELAAIDFQRGFCINFASTLTVVIGTVMELPVSSTHCQVGAVFCVGLAADGYGKVAWGMLSKIALCWVITLPFSGGLAAAMTAVLSLAVKN